MYTISESIKWATRIHILQPFELQLLYTGSGNPQDKNMYLQYMNEAVAVVHRSCMIIYYSVLPLVTMMAFVTEIFEPAFSFTNASSSGLIISMRKKQNLL